MLNQFMHVFVKINNKFNTNWKDMWCTVNKLRNFDLVIIEQLLYSFSLGFNPMSLPINNRGSEYHHSHNN